MNFKLANRLAATGLTQVQIAEKLGISERTLRYCLSGSTTWPQARLRKALRDLTTASDGELGFAPPLRGATKGDGEVLQRRDLLRLTSGALAGTAVAALVPTKPAGRHIGQSDVDGVTAAATSMAHTDRALGGGALRADAVRGYYERTEAALMGGLYRNRETREAGAVALARLASVAGWAMADAGHHALAQQILISGLTAARRAGRDGPTHQAHLLGDLSRQALYLGRYETAVGLMVQAQRLNLPPAVASMVSARKARALGGVGNIDAAWIARTTAPAVDLYDPTVYGLPESYCLAELHSDIGHASYSLAVHHGQASTGESLRRSIQLYQPNQGRSAALARVRLVQTLIASHEEREAATWAASILPTLGHLQSGAVARAALDTWPLLRRHAGRPGVAEISDMLRDAPLSA